MGKAEDRVDPLPGAELSSHGKGERAKGSGDLPVVADQWGQWVASWRRRDPSVTGLQGTCRGATVVGQFRNGGGVT